MSERSDPAAAKFARLAEEVFAAEGPTETAEQVVALAAAEIDAEHVGLHLFEGKSITTVASTSSVPAAAAQLGEPGPYRDGQWGRQALLVDLQWDQRWPQWCRSVAAFGPRHLLAVELVEDGQRVGVLSLFAEHEEDFSDEDIAFAHVFARHSALALQAADRDAHLKVALDGRKLIGQAQGILMERYGLDDAQAFSVLRRISQNHNIKLRHIAHTLVQTRQLPGEPPQTSHQEQPALQAEVRSARPGLTVEKGRAGPAQ